MGNEGPCERCGGMTHDRICVTCLTVENRQLKLRLDEAKGLMEEAIPLVGLDPDYEQSVVIDAWELKAKAFLGTGEGRNESTGKCPGCKCPHDWNTVKSHTEHFDGPTICTRCGVEES